MRFQARSADRDPPFQSMYSGSPSRNRADAEDRRNSEDQFAGTRLGADQRRPSGTVTTITLHSDPSSRL
jgi:hypothetical protein